MIKNFYHNGVKTLTVILSVLLSAHFVSAQSCGSIDLGDDVEVCSGSSATLTPTEDFKLTGNLESLLAYRGVVSNPSYALGAPDGSGAYFCRGNSGKYTGAVWSLPCNLPSGTKLKIRMKVPSGTAYFKVYGAKDNYYYSSDYTLIACKYVSGSSYQDICVTTNGEFNIIKIIDKGCSPFKVDAITFEKTCTATYSWSSGQTTKSITVSPTTTTSYVLTASVCGNTLKDTVEVAVKSCNSGDPTCSKVVGNTRGCSSKPYVIWLKDKNGNAHHLSGDSTDYKWYEYANGDAKLIATGISASGLSGTFDVELVFSGMTSTPPTNSPKYSSCFTVGSTTGWNYFTTTTGTLTSTNYGTMSLSRKGPAAQIGDGANITQDGYGASGWFNITGGTGYITTGDFNVMLSGCILPALETMVCSDDTLSICIDDLINLDSIYGEDVTVQASTSTSGAKVMVETGSYTMGVDCCNGNKPNAITYQYVSSNKIDNSQTNSNVRTYTNPNGAKALIIVSGNSTASDTSNPLYRGYVNAGEKFTVIRSQSNKWQANHYIRIMSADGSSLLQFSNIHVSCSQPLVSGEQYGNIVISSVTTNGSTCSGGAPDCEASLTYIPTTGFTGLDTISFEVCTSGANSWCTDVPVIVEVKNCSVTPECKTIVGNTRGCANTPYVIYLVDKNGAAHHLKGDSTSYLWNVYTNGTAQFTASGISATGLSGTFDVDLTFSGATTTPPTNSPKYSSCFTVGSVNGWVYYPTTSGTITSTNYGTMSISRQGPSFQVGDGANITQDGFGASGWLAISGGNGFIKAGDINIMLTEECDTNSSECDETHTFDPCIVTYGKGSYNNSSTTISISETVSQIKEIVVEGIYKGGKPTAGSFTNGTTTVSWTGSDAKELDNVSGTSDKGYYQATLPAASSVTMNVSNNQSKMHGMAAYVIMKDEFCEDNFTAVSDERYYTYHNTQTSTFSMPVTINAKNITAVLPIAEMNNDTRIAEFTLTAGSLSESVTINTYDLGRSMTLQTLSLNDVPGGITSATLTMKSPSSNGDSYVTGSAMFNWYLPCETNSGKNRIAGTVFFDADRDTTLDNSEDGHPSVTVYLYDDKDDDGMLDDNELDPIDSVLSASDGTFEFFVDYVCNEGYIDNVEYQYSIDNPSNLLGEPGTNFATYNNNADNLIVELGGTIKDGEQYSIFLKTIESGAYAIISESTDGINFYHNTNIAITSSSKGEYTITADRDVNYIKFDKNTINSISGYNSYGSTSTNSADYAIYGVQFCKGINSFLIDTDLATYPGNTELTTDNYEFAQFDGPNQEDVGNDYGFNGPVEMSGYVFYDADSSGTFDSGESGTPNITVYLFPDLDNDGVLDLAESLLLITSVETAQNGYYEFERDYIADLLNLPDGLLNSYIITTDRNDYPANSTYTTDNQEEAEFDSYGQEDPDNNFGHVQSAPLNYCGKLEVTIDKNKVDGSSGHENFPVYLDLTHNAFKYRQNWPYSWDQGMFSPNGYDVQVCNANGDELPIEIVGYDSTIGNLKLWVKVDKLSSTANTILTVKHGVSSGNVSNPSSPDVWGSDYKAVYHFEDLNDATNNNNDANNFGSSLATGQMGSSVDLDGNDYLRVPYSSSLDITGKKLTMSAWVNVAANPSSDAPFAVKGPSVNQEAYMFGVDGGTNPVKINSRVTTNTGHYRHDDGSLPVNQWVFVQFVYDGDLSSGQKKVYVNGSLSHSKSASGDINTGSHDLFIGKRVYSDNRYLTGKIDELRIACAATSADWISTEYNNQLSPTTFATITDSSGCGAVPVTWLDFTAKKVSANDVELNWSTASEINNSHFEVERSFDGNSFSMIGSPVQGAGNSAQIERYDAMDYDLPEGVVYYRVKQIDFDGQFDYTPVRVVEVLSRHAMVVYPIPAKNEVHISFKGAKGQEVVITNLTGQVLDRVILSSEGSATVNTTDYPQGMYFVEVQGANMVKTHKFTIEK